MRLSWTCRSAALCILVAALVFCATLAGCDHYCVAINSNPGGSVNPTAGCQSTASTGTITLTFNSSVAPDSEIAPVRPPHIFVTLRAIEALPAPISGEAASWQEIAPQLAAHPVQIDLAARAGDLCATGPLGTATVPAGVYAQLALRMVPNPDPENQPSHRPAIGAPLLDESACGPNLLNCLIPPNAGARPVSLDDSEVLIPSGHIADGFIRILPGSHMHLRIALDPHWSVALPAVHAIRLIPSFTVFAEPLCPSSD